MRVCELGSLSLGESAALRALFRFSLFARARSRDSISCCFYYPSHSRECIVCHSQKRDHLKIIINLNSLGTFK